MKFVASILLLALSLTSQGKSFDCYLRVGMVSAQELAQTAFAGNDPEEESEEYQLNLVSGLKAYVLYLPYQDGLYLSLEKAGVSVSTNFDQESDDFANLDLKIEDKKYSLYCSKN